MKKNLLLASGHILLMLGIIGIFIPVLPTTPFLLITAACYLRGSERMYGWLVNHKVFGVFIRQYFEYKAVTKKTKIVALVFLWTGILISAIFFIDLLWVRALVLLIAVGVSVHILMLRTLKNIP